MADLLGGYQSNIAAWHTQELLRLVQQAAALGEYGGGKLFDTAAANALKKQGEDFTGIPAIPAGTRATADSLNDPLSRLAARYAAIVKENEDFLSRIDQFLSVLEKDSLLVDQLIAAARMEAWVARQAPLTLAKKFYLDFGASHGAAAISVPILSTHRNSPPRLLARASLTFAIKAGEPG